MSQLILTTPTNPAGASGGAVWQALLTAQTSPISGAAIDVTLSRAIALALFVAGETNTLAAPTFVGQRMSFNVAGFVALANRAITSATAINQAGNTVMTFNALDDYIELVSVATGAATMRWQVVANNGVVLS